MRNSVHRVGNFTSSEIYNLLSMGSRPMTEEELAIRPKTGKGSKTTLVEDGFGEAAFTYILDCNTERKLGRAIESEVSTKATSWGSLVEKKVFQILSTDYIWTGDRTIVHPDYDCYSGSPDVLSMKTVGDLKSPFTLKSFCSLVNPIYDGLEGMEAMNAIRFGYTNKEGIKVKKHPDGEKFFWQLVSSSILADKDFAELIVYAPYQSELESIREIASQLDDYEEQKNYYGIIQDSDERLPWLKEGGYYKNLNKIVFEVPKEDKMFLLERIKEASKYLITNERITSRVQAA